MLWVCPHALNLPDSFHSIFIISDLSLHPEDFSVSWIPSSSTALLIIFAPSFYRSCVCLWCVWLCITTVLCSLLFFCFTDELYMHTYNKVVIKKSIQRTLEKRYCKYKCSFEFNQISLAAPTTCTTVWCCFAAMTIKVQWCHWHGASGRFWKALQTCRDHMRRKDYKTESNAVSLHPGEFIPPSAPSLYLLWSFHVTFLLHVLSFALF